jgi:hypothetical protein
VKLKSYFNEITQVHYFKRFANRNNLQMKMSAKKYMKIQQEELDAKKEEEKDKLWMALKR